MFANIQVVDKVAILHKCGSAIFFWAAKHVYGLNSVNLEYLLIGAVAESN